MENFVLALGATLIVSSISFIGILLILKKLQPQSRLVTAFVSFAAGALIGDAFLHLLPEHIEAFGFEPTSALGVFIGVLFMLIIEAYFHCSHDSTQELEDHHTLAKMNILGDGVHNFLDGMAIGASFLVSPALGIASTIAIVLHEIPQELADTAILVYSGWRRRKILIINFLTALTAVLGTIAAFSLEALVEGAERVLLPVAIGQFIYIALADLVPEIHKKAGVTKYVIEIGMFIIGLAIMYSLTLFE